MTPREIDLALAGAADRDLHVMRVAQMVAYSLAGLVGHAYHQPNKMPSFAKAFPDPRQARAEGGVQSADEAVQNMQAWTDAIAAHQNRNILRVRA